MIVEAAGLLKTAEAEPENVLGQNIVDQVPYPTDAFVLKSLIAQAHVVGMPTTMICPIQHENEVSEYHIKINRHGPAQGLIMTAFKI